jgi:Dimerisation domain
MAQSEPRPQIPAPPALMDLITGKWASQAVFVAAKLGIADMLKDGPRECDEIARANQVDAGALYRVLRALASLGVFAEIGERRFALTPMAEHLRSDVPGSLLGLASMSGEDLFWRPWGDVFRCVKTGEPAVARVFGKGLFECLAEDSQMMPQPQWKVAEATPA